MNKFYQIGQLCRVFNRLKGQPKYGTAGTYTRYGYGTVVHSIFANASKKILKGETVGRYVLIEMDNEELVDVKVEAPI